MRNTVDVIILICKLNSNWCDCDDVVVTHCSDNSICKGTKCAYALSKLLSRGYELLSTEALENNCGQLVYTLAKCNS